MNSMVSAKVGDIADVQGGLQVSGAMRASYSRKVPYLRVANVFRDRLDLREIKEIGVSDQELSRARLAPGDILVVEGHGNPDEVGRCATWAGQIEPCVHQNHLIRVRPDPSAISSRFVSLFLNSPLGRSQLFRAGKTTSGLNTINITNVRELVVPLPPLAEQERIADILDQADALRAKRRAALAHLDTLTQAIFLDMFGDPAISPRKRPLRPLGDLVSFVGGGTPSRSEPRYFEGAISWATSKDMKHEFLDDTEEHITEEAIALSATKLVPVGTVLVVVKSKVLAHSLPVAIARVPTCFGQDLKGLVPVKDWSAFYLATSLRLGKSRLLEKARGLNTEGLTLEHLRSFPILDASRAEQIEFERRAAHVERMKTSLRSSLTQLDALFASLQHRAFRGEL